MELNKVVTVLEALEDSKVVQKDKQQQQQNSFTVGKNCVPSSYGYSQNITYKHGSLQVTVFLSLNRRKSTLLYIICLLFLPLLALSEIPLHRGNQLQQKQMQMPASKNLNNLQFFTLPYDLSSKPQRFLKALSSSTRESVDLYAEVKSGKNYNSLPTITTPLPSVYGHITS